MKKYLSIVFFLFTLFYFSQTWNINGNSGINSNSQFVGTLDNQDLVFKTNNTEYMRITSSGKIRIGTKNKINIKPENSNSILRVYGDVNPFIEIVNPFGQFTINKATCKNCFAREAIPGDAVLRNLGVSHNIIFYMPNDNNDGSTYVGIGDDTNSIWAKFYNNKTFKLNGKMAIGHTNLDCRDCSEFDLFVKNGIRTEKIKVDLSSESGWADYVFKPDYDLKPLEDVEKYIKEKEHLPDIPSAKDIVKNGINLAEMDAKLLQKIEELTLYSIEQNKQLKEQAARIEYLERLMKNK